MIQKEANIDDIRREFVEKAWPIDLVYRDKPVQLKSGEVSDFYADMKKGYGYPELLKLASEGVFKMMDSNVTCVAAAGYGGVPLATSISLNHGLKLTLVRETEKNHGKGGMLDGYVPNKEDKIAVVDDVFTSGSSILKIVSALGPEINVSGCYVVVKRGDADIGREVKHLVTVDQLRRV